jgi:hypothetical protein
LVIGTLVPDLPYFLFLEGNKGLGHSLHGVFEFCLPVGLALLWLFHALIKRPMAAIAPDFFRRRIDEADLQFRFTPLSRFLRIVSSLLLGVATHILWDGFTHENGYFVKQWSVLSVPVRFFRVTPLWHALQLLCSVLGVALVVIVGMWVWRRRPLAQNPVRSSMSSSLRWFLIGIVSAIAAMAGLAAGFNTLVHEHYGWRGSVVQSVIVAMTTCSIELLLFSAAWHWNRRQTARDS